MANNTYNLRGVLVRVQDNQNSWHYHYLMFIDLDSATTQDLIPKVTWSYRANDGNDQTPYLAGIYAAAPVFPQPPTGAAGTTVRTFYIGMCTLTAEQTAQNLTPMTIAKLRPAADQPTIATGDPSSRKPPIVRHGTVPFPSGNGVAYGLQSQLGSYTYGGVTTNHAVPDYFVIACCHVPPPFGNTMVTMTNPANKILCTPIGTRNPGNPGDVLAIGCFDCTVNNFKIENGFPKGGIKTTTTGSALVQTVKAVIQPEPGDISIFWADL